MQDLQFDIINRELVMNGGDFVATSDRSAQNGGILLRARATNAARPDFGIGIEEVMNSDMTKLTFEMNRWKQMAKNDGATLANWKAVNTGASFGLSYQVSYE